SIAPEAQSIFCRRRRPQLSVALRLLHLRTIHRAENIGSALKRGVNVCQRQFINEVLGPLVTELIRNFSGEDATPIQHAFPTAAFSIKLGKLVRHRRRPPLAKINPDHVAALSTKSNVEPGRPIRSAESAQPNRGFATSGSPGSSPPSRRQIRT